MLETRPRRGQATGGVHSFVVVRFDLKRRAWTSSCGQDGSMVQSGLPSLRGEP